MDTAGVFTSRIQQTLYSETTLFLISDQLESIFQELRMLLSITMSSDISNREQHLKLMEHWRMRKQDLPHALISEKRHVLIHGLQTTSLEEHSGSE
jgi:hypothetical protein